MNIQIHVLKTPKEKSVISGSFATPEAIAHLMVQKYVSKESSVQELSVAIPNKRRHRQADCPM